LEFGSDTDVDGGLKLLVLTFKNLVFVQAQNFRDLLIERMIFAGAQATQNPICFSLIPELFPNERNTAMAVYNSAIYIGRALSFGAVIIASKLGVANSVTDKIGVIMVRPWASCHVCHSVFPWPMGPCV
jgi:predicted MFS family arabinose efflux permease